MPDFAPDRALVIVNPRSVRARRLIRLLAPYSLPLDRTVTIARGQLRLAETEGSGDAGRLAREASQRYGADLLVMAAGGDGSTGEVAGALAGTATPMLVLPVGSGNDFARTIYREKPRDGIEVLEALGWTKNGPERLLAEILGENLCIRPVDLLEVDCREAEWTDSEVLARPHDVSSYCLNVISIGFDSRVAMFANRFTRRFGSLGPMTYVLGVVRLLFADKRFRMRVRVGDQEEGTLDYSLAAVCNASYYGGGFQPAPGAKINDGLLDSRVSRVVTVMDILRLAGTYKQGDEKALSLFLQTQSPGFRALAEGADPLYLTVDGEGLLARELEVRVAPGALRLAWPASYGLPACFLAE
ncbi:MAG: diacylglycerol kinase family protein [Bacillota bacterium]|nr:diacylglycerol kinase family protein [Bacillota bacterium]